MKSIGQLSTAALGAWVQEHLRVKGIDMVLSGGACVSIYSNGKYVSMDLDMIHTGLLAPKRNLIREVMTSAILHRPRPSDTYSIMMCSYSGSSCQSTHWRIAFVNAYGITASSCSTATAGNWQTRNKASIYPRTSPSLIRL